MDIVYLMSSEGHFGSMNSGREREKVFSKAVETFY